MTRSERRRRAGRPWKPIAATAIIGMALVAAPVGQALAAKGKSCAHAIRIVQRAGKLRFTFVLSTAGFRLDLGSGKGKTTIVVSYGQKTVSVQAPGSNGFQQQSLADTVNALAHESKRLKSAVVAYDGDTGPQVRIVPKKGAGRITSTGTSSTIAGLSTKGYKTTVGGSVERLWIASGLPQPPRSVRRLLSRLPLGAPGSKRFDLGHLPLKIQTAHGKKWTTVLSTQSASCVNVGPKAFQPALARSARAAGARADVAHRSGAAPLAHAASLPAHLTHIDPLGAIGRSPQVYALYWGREFASQSGWVSSMNNALHTLVGGSYLDGTAQYGVGRGQFLGSRTINSDPPAEVGGGNGLAPAGGFLDVVGFVLGQRWQSWDTPKYWVPGGNEPVIAVFVPNSVLNSGSWGGYHALTLVEPMPFMSPIMPFLVVRVPDPGGTPNLSAATSLFTHELVEAGTNPIPLDGWIDPGQPWPPWENAEPGDVCEHTSPVWPEHVSFEGLTVSTYWSNSDNRCVPGAPLSVQITSPSSGATVTQGHGIGLSGSATDPLDGALTGSHLSWSDSVQGDLGTGANLIAPLGPGTHTVTLTATDSQGITRQTTVTFTVAPGRPTVQITDPSNGSTFGTDQTIAFHGSATDPQDGALAGTSLVWRLLQGSTLIRILGSGEQINTSITTPGDYTVELLATDAEGANAEASITVHITAPSGNPSVSIDSPADGSNFYTSCSNSPYSVTFTGHATDPTDGTLTGAHLVWYDDYNGNHVQMGTGTSVTYGLFQTCPGETSHTITLVATDSLGHHSADTIHVTTGAPG